MAHYVVNISQGIKIATSVTTNTIGEDVIESFYLDWKAPILLLTLIIFTAIILIFKHFLIKWLEKRFEGKEGWIVIIILVSLIIISFLLGLLGFGGLIEKIIEESLG